MLSSHLTKPDLKKSNMNCLFKLCIDLVGLCQQQKKSCDFKL